MATGTTVGTSTNTNPLYFTAQSRGPYHINGRYYLIWFDGVNIVWSHSTDLVSWAEKQTALPDTSSIRYAVVCDGGNLHFIYAPTTSALYYKKGTPDASGAISFGAERLVIATTNIGTPVVNISSDGHLFATYMSGPSSTYPSIIKNADTIAQDTWTTAANFPAQLASASYNLAILAPMADGGMYVISASTSRTSKFRTCSSTGTLGTEVDATIGNLSAYPSLMMIVDGSILHLAYVKATTFNLVIRDRAADGTWGPEVVIQETTTSNTVPTLILDPVTHDYYVVWTNKPTDQHIFSRKCVGGTIWDDVVDWLDESSDGGITSTNIVSPPIAQNWNLLVAYKTRTSSPYNVKIAALQLGRVVEFTVRDSVHITDRATVAAIRPFTVTDELHVDDRVARIRSIPMSKMRPVSGRIVARAPGGRITGRLGGGEPIRGKLGSKPITGRLGGGDPIIARPQGGKITRDRRRRK